MQKFCTCFLILGVLLFCTTAFGQGSPTVYVSGGPTPAQLATPPPCFAPNPMGSPDELDSGEVCQPSVYVANMPFPAAPSVFATDSNGGQPQGMVLGPDNYLYVCEPQTGTIIRFNVTSPSSTQIVFTTTGSGLKNPQCGHFTSDGSLIVSDQSAGSGVYEFQNTAAPSISVPLSLSSTPTNVLGSSGGSPQLPATFTGAGLTQLKNGDLAFVDQANGNLYLAPYSSTYPHFSTAREIATALTGAIGVARNSASDIFVSYVSGNIVRLHSNYVSGASDFGNNTEFATGDVTQTSCFSSATDQPEFMQFSADDTLYAATQTLSDTFSNPGKVLSITLTSAACNAPTTVTTLPRWDSDSIGGDDNGNPDGDDEYIQGYGIALPPTSVTNSPFSDNPAGTLLYNFGFSAFEAILPSPPSACSSSLMVTETQVFPANMENGSQVPDLGLFPIGVTGAEPFWGEGGLINVYTINDVACPQASADIIMGNFSNLTNPRVIECDLGHCTIDPPLGAFPGASLIPGDSGLGGKAIPASSFYESNLPPTPASAGQTQAAYVCGPFFWRDIFFWDPSAVVDPDDLTLTVIFRLTNIPANPATGALCTGTNVKGVTNAQVVPGLAYLGTQASPAFSFITLQNHVHPSMPASFTDLGFGWYSYSIFLRQLGVGNTPPAVGTYGFSVMFTSPSIPFVPAKITVVPEE